MDVAGRIAEVLGVHVKTLGAMSGGCVGEVYRVALEDGEEVVAKVDEGRDARLEVEGFMLEYLGEHSNLPVPRVRYMKPDLLIMDLLAGDSAFSKRAEVHAAELLADLHAISAPQCGLERDTLIGGLHQPNPMEDSWIGFFREQRLLHMARKAEEEGRLGPKDFGRIEAFANRLEDLLEEPDSPVLLHGDVWTSNVLSDGHGITGFIDPAIYYGHPEIELAFITLFNTFGDPFFARYKEIRGVDPDFFEVRRDIYNMYPLLVHVRLFGGGYFSGVDRVLRRHGF